MESITSPKKIASSNSSSPPLPRWKHEVFLSFYGDDTRKGFTDHLYSALKRKGIQTFRDDEKLPRGKYVTPELLGAIQESIYAVVVISPRYAFSTFCLIELAEIMERMRYNRIIVFPVFYHVDPSDVRKHRGTFAEAFDKHDQDPTVDAEKKQTWRDALTTVANLSGWFLEDYRHEATVVEQISRTIFSELIRRFSISSSKLVGIEAHVEEMVKLLGIGSDEQDVRFIGIHGMGGVGKTTLAKVIFDRVSYHFEASSFIVDIRMKAKAQGLGSLRKQLLSEIMEEEMGRFNAYAGLNVIENRLRSKRVLIVLDEVGSEDQLEALAGGCDWFGPGSRIIFTSRDSGLLRSHGGDDIYLYEVKPLNDNDGLNYPQKKILDSIQLSFDGLNDSQKELFLDIACLCEGKVLDELRLEALESFGYAKIDIDVLIERSLIVNSEGRVSMHDLLQERGQNIVDRESPEKPCQRSRLWHYDDNDVLHVLESDTGNDAIEGLVLSLPILRHLRSNAKALAKMKRLRILRIGSTIIV